MLRLSGSHVIFIAHAERLRCASKPLLSIVPPCQSFPNVPRALFALAVSRCALLFRLRKGTLGHVVISILVRDFPKSFIIFWRFDDLSYYPSSLCLETPRSPSSSVVTNGEARVFSPSLNTAVILISIVSKQKAVFPGHAICPISRLRRSQITLLFQSNLQPGSCSRISNYKAADSRGRGVPHNP